MQPQLVSDATTGSGWDAAIDIAVLVLILVGALLCLTAALGVLRFRDVPSRLHAATKPQVLGFVLICLAVALSLRSWPVVAFLLPVVLVQLATSPLSAHMIARQAHRNGTLDRGVLVEDDLARIETGSDEGATRDVQRRIDENTDETG